jgi:hypothetical protein
MLITACGSKSFVKYPCRSATGWNIPRNLGYNSSSGICPNDTCNQALQSHHLNYVVANDASIGSPVGASGPTLMSEPSLTEAEKAEAPNSVWHYGFANLFMALKFVPNTDSRGTEQVDGSYEAHLTSMAASRYRGICPRNYLAVDFSSCT